MSIKYGYKLYKLLNIQKFLFVCFLNEDLQRNWLIQQEKYTTQDNKSVNKCLMVEHKFLKLRSARLSRLFTEVFPNIAKDDNSLEEIPG